MNYAEMIERRAVLLKNVSVIVDGADTDGVPLNDDQQAQVDAMLGEADDLQAQADTAERKMRLEAAKNNLKESTTRKVPQVFATPKRGNNKNYQPELLKQWLLHGTRAFAPSQELFRAAEDAGVDFAGRNFRVEMRTQTKGTTTAGGYTVPTDFGTEIVNQMKYFCPIRDYCTVIRTENGQNLPFPTNDDSGNLAAITTEAVAPSPTDTVFGQVTLGAYSYRTMVQLSDILLTDSAFDLETYLSQRLGERIGRAQSADFLTGSGSGAPQGLVTAATTVGFDWTTTFQNLVKLFSGLDQSYRGRGVWIMSSAVASDIRSLVDNNNRPLLNMMNAFDDGAVESLFRRPIVISEAMDSSGTSKKVIVFGDPTNFYIRDVNEMVISKTVDRYWESGIVAFMASLRSDSKWIGTSRSLLAGVTASS